MNGENTWTQGGEHHTPGPGGAWGARGERALEQIPNACRASNLDDWLIGAAKHRGTRIPMFQTCTSCTCTPELGGDGGGETKKEGETETERDRERQREEGRKEGRKEASRQAGRQAGSEFSSEWIPFP